MHEEKMERIVCWDIGNQSIKIVHKKFLVHVIFNQWSLKYHGLDEMLPMQNNRSQQTLFSAKKHQLIV